MGFKVKKEFAVIGLGSFGMSVVETFMNYNVDLIVLDMDEEKIQKVANKVDFACAIDTTDEEALISSGIKNVDHVIVGIGDDVEGCIMTVMALKNIGIENITVKNQNVKDGIEENNIDLVFLDLPKPFEIFEDVVLV